MKDRLPGQLYAILTQTESLQTAYLVGGCVRDWLLDLPIKDFDIEVFGVSYEQLVDALKRWGRTDLVGRSFGVVKLTIASGETFDFSIPRRDSKIGIGHKGFQISFDPSIGLKEAASRRDFTINAFMYDLRKEELLDFFGGERDLRNRILRHTSDAFVEDPLRVLRGMQFVARFKLKPAMETIELCRRIQGSYRELAAERIREEWFKWAEKSQLPSAGLRYLEQTGWIEHFPELNALRGVPQEPEWHPEGDVFVHTCHCCDALVKLPEWQAADSQSRIAYMLAVLAHDFGKAHTTSTVEKDGRIRVVSPGHDEASGPLAESFLSRINTPVSIRERVVPLVVNHMAHLQALSDRGLRRLAKRLEPENIANLSVVMHADHMGRPPKPAIRSEKAEFMRKRAGELKVESKPEPPIILGRHLIELGMKPGKEFAPILNAAYDAQIEGNFFNLREAKQWLLLQPTVELPETAREKLSQMLMEPEQGSIK